MKSPSSYLFNTKSLLSLLIVSLNLIIPISSIIALDSPIQSLDVNGVNIYNIGGGYNASHGIEGITYDVGTHTLTMTNATVNRISASGDLDINIVGTNTIAANTDSAAILAMGGDLTITGDSASLTVSALAANHPAITIGAGGRLTIGAAGTSITVTVTQGVLYNCEDTYVVEGNTFTPPVQEGPGDPPPGDPIQIYIGENLVIDEVSDPQVTSASGTGWSVEYSPYGGYQFNIDATVLPTFDYISGTGDGTISINAIGGDVTLLDNLGYSIYFDGNVEVLFGLGEVGNVQLNGGIFTNGGVIGGDGDVFIGTSGNPSTFGVGARHMAINYSNFTINTIGVGLYYYNPAPEVGEGMEVQARQGADLIVQSSGTATSNVNSITVFGGGLVDLTYTTDLGTFIPQAGYWEWAEFTGTEVENTEPTIVTCEEGIDATNKYSLTISSNNYLLESTAKALFQLGFNYDDSEDSRVENGTVNVIAANGYKFVSGGFYDFSIEEGTEVTIELLPNYGYQYVSGGINGIPTSPESGKASYTFTMPATHVHISAIFQPSSDIVSVETDTIKSASLVIPGTQINGNAELLVDNAEGVLTSSFESVAEGFEVGTYLDLSLNEVIYKGTTEEVWRTNITQLEQDTTVTLTLSDNLKGHAEYKVLRDHEGAIEELEATYNPSTGTLTFDTDSYSTYALAFNDPINPNTYDGIIRDLSVGLMSICILLGVTLYTRKSKKSYL